MNLGTVSAGLRNKKEAATAGLRNKKEAATAMASSKISGISQKVFKYGDSAGSPEAISLDTQISKDGVRLEATMTLKYSKATGKRHRWFKAYVVLDITDGGTFKYYDKKPKKLLPSKTDRFDFRKSTRVGSTKDLTGLEDSSLRLEIPANIDWVVKDLEHSSRRFVIEIPYEESNPDDIGSVSKRVMDEDSNFDDAGSSSHLSVASSSKHSFASLGNLSGLNEFDDSEEGESVEEAFDPNTAFTDLMSAVRHAKEKGQPFRLHVQCLRRGGKEKQLWMKAFEDLGRMSYDLHRRAFGIRKVLKDPSLKLKHERIRKKDNDKFAKQNALLDQLSEKIHDSDDDSIASQKKDFRINERPDLKECLVYPTYAYPNCWMTDSELYNEMLKPAEVFHDLRISSEKQREIGTFKVEILECSGIPSLDWGSDSDAVVYLVCGSYAFTSDVIVNKLNPVWLPRSRRACIFPLFHAYAKVFAGVFDDDGKGKNDDLVGRVVIDVARCRPGSTYDVALPLRLSKHVYSRRKRGSVRLRFSIEYNSERAAILSYIPQSPRGLAMKRPDDDTTILCHDEKAFRNIALTVHGQHFPGKFTMNLMKATLREVDMLKKLSITKIENRAFEIVFWNNPSISFLLFTFWMSNVYHNSLRFVPFQLCFCFLLLMMETYAFYGTDGRIQQGFIPPSFEEMLAALFTSPHSKKKVIEPLFVKPHRDERSALADDAAYRTHHPKGKWLFKKLGFADTTEQDQPEDYQVEIHLSRGIQHPITQDYQYPRFTIEESRCPKKQRGSKLQRISDMDNNFGDFLTRLNLDENDGDDNDDGQSANRNSSSNNILSSRRKGSTKPNENAEDHENDDEQNFSSYYLESNSTRNLSKEDKKEFRSSLPPPDQVKTKKGFLSLPPRPKRGDLSKATVAVVSEILGQATDMFDDQKKAGVNKALDEAYLALPPILRIPEQRIDYSTISEKKKASDELEGIRDLIHKFSFHLFLDKTYAIGYEDSMWFGGRPSKDVKNDLDRLLGAGQFANSNPLISLVSVHLEPIVRTIHGVICVVRQIINILTWQDPILSFWVSIGFIVFAFVLAIFPYRHFFFVVGFCALGPQNYVFIRYIKPSFVEEFKEKKQAKTLAKIAKRKEKKFSGIPENQPIISCHTTNNVKRRSFSLDEVEKKALHQVCVPYSQLTYRRDNYWPPQPEYAKCDPNIEGFEKSIAKLQKLSAREQIIGSAVNRASR